MGELEEKLGAILSNQDAMSQIMALAQSLGSGPQQSPPAPSEAAAQEPPTSETGPLALGGLDPRLLSMAARLAGAYNSADDDRRVALLTALGPFVKPERRPKLEKAIQIAKLTRMARIALDSFRAKGDANV